MASVNELQDDEQHPPSTSLAWGIASQGSSGNIRDDGSQVHPDSDVLPPPPSRNTLMDDPLVLVDAGYTSSSPVTGSLQSHRLTSVDADHELPSATLLHVDMIAGDVRRSNHDVDSAARGRCSGAVGDGHPAGVRASLGQAVGGDGATGARSSSSSSSKRAPNKLTAGVVEAAERATDSDDSTDEDSRCAVCFLQMVHPVRLPCNHVFCFLCVKGVAITSSRRCALCRQSIPAEFLLRPTLVHGPVKKLGMAAAAASVGDRGPGPESDALTTLQTTTNRKDASVAATAGTTIAGCLSAINQTLEEARDELNYEWFYEGRNGWWKYDQRTSKEIESFYVKEEQTCQIMVVGLVFVVDFTRMLQYRIRDPSKRRRIKRDLSSVPAKGIAGISLKRLDGVDDDHHSDDGLDAPTAAPRSSAAGGGSVAAAATPRGSNDSRGDAELVVENQRSHMTDQEEELTMAQAPDAQYDGAGYSVRRRRNPSILTDVMQRYRQLQATGSSSAAPLRRLLPLQPEARADPYRSVVTRPAVTAGSLHRMWVAHASDRNDPALLADNAGAVGHHQLHDSAAAGTVLLPPEDVYSSDLEQYELPGIPDVLPSPPPPQHFVYHCHLRGRGHISSSSPAVSQSSRASVSSLAAGGGDDGRQECNCDQHCCHIRTCHTCLPPNHCFCCHQICSGRRSHLVPPSSSLPSNVAGACGRSTSPLTEGAPDAACVALCHNDCHGVCCCPPPLSLAAAAPPAAAAAADTAGDGALLHHGEDCPPLSVEQPEYYRLDSDSSLGDYEHDESVLISQLDSIDISTTPVVRLTTNTVAGAQSNSQLAMGSSERDAVDYNDQVN